MRAAYRRTAAAGVAVLLVGAAATAARAQGDGDGAQRYRLATATLGNVEQTMALSGTVEHAARSDVGFATNGTVARVYVEPGDRVKAGQKLAVLDTSALRAAVTEAEATLAQAKAQLEADQDAQDEIVEDTVQQETPTEPEQPTTPQQPESSQPSQPDPAVTEALKEIAAQQKAVAEAQTGTTEAIAAAKAALAAQQEACQPETTGTQDCTDALVAVQSAQDAVAQAQDSLQQALAALTERLTKALSALSSQTSNQPTAARTTDSVVVPAVAMDTSSDSDQAASSAGTIASDQAAIDQAKSDLLTAEHELAAAVLRAPRAGTVAALDLKRGDNVSAGGTVLTVIGKGATTVSASSTADKVTSLKVGQRAAVTVPGRDKPLTGKITAIGLLPTSAEDETTYPVTITLDGGGTIPTGSTASAAVVVATARNVVTVPASAVSAGTVKVLEDDRAVAKKVTVGAVGTTTIQVTGIDAGTRVVLADRDAALPSQQQNRGFDGGLGGPRNGFSGPGGPVIMRTP